MSNGNVDRAFTSEAVAILAYIGAFHASIKRDSRKALRKPGEQNAPSPENQRHGRRGNRPASGRAG